MTPTQVAHIMALVDKLKRFSHPIDRHEAAEVVAEIESALRDAPQAEGWVLVPVEPNPKMLEALRVGSKKDWPSDELCRVRYAAMLAAMLAATPSAPTAVEPDERANLKAAVIELLKHFPTDTDMMEAGWTVAEIDAACTAYDMGQKTLQEHDIAARASKGTPK